MSHDLLTTYGELAQVIDSLGLIVRERRRQSRLSVRGAAAEIGVSFSKVSRLENGSDLDGKSLAAILRWLDGPETAPDAPTDVPRLTDMVGLDPDFTGGLSTVEYLRRQWTGDPEDAPKGGED
jgi:transcriptional regulator with XRE-family HTH domain